MTNRRHRWAVLVTLLAAVVTAVLAPLAARADTESRCDGQHPDQDWSPVTDDQGVVVYAAALDSSIAARFADDAREIAAMLRSDLGIIPEITLCLFGSDTSLDGSDLREKGLLPPGQRLHVAMFTADALLFVDTQQFRLVPDAIAVGFAHIALWQLAEMEGRIGYPEPLAGAVAQWYAARRNGKLTTHRATMRVATFYGDPNGNAPASDWLSGAQEPLSAWNPEYQESPIGSLVDDAVAHDGTAILRDFDPEVWAAAELRWRAALRDELLQGADESRDWIGGALIAGGAVAAAIGFALWGRRQNRRRQIPMGDIAQVEGFFDR